MTAKKVTRARGSRDEVTATLLLPPPWTDWRARTGREEGEAGSKTLLMNGVYDGPR